jgi:replication fork protection complex subunit Tof1/Swi1
MEESSNEDDQEIAENIQSNLFYEQATHERVMNLLRSYKDQGRGYLDAVTELSHVFIRTLENYSKQNQDMQIRSRRRTRAKKQSQKNLDDQAAADDESGGEAEVAAKTSRERKFDFARFSARFMSQGCVDTFVSFVKFYKDLNPEQLKRAHRFFYRVAFKLDLSSVLFRVDIIHLFQNMINGPDALDREFSCFGDWKELIRQLFKKLLKRLEERPELMVEMLFSKIPSTQFYLEHGHVRETVKSTPKPPADLEVKPIIATSDQISVVTEALIADAQFDLISWVKGELERAAVERESWAGLEAAREAEKNSMDPLGNELAHGSQQAEDGAEKPLPQAIGSPTFVRISTSLTPAAVLPKDKDIESKMFKNGRFRLLLTLIGFDRTSDEDVPGALWMIPSTLTAEDLRLSLSRIHRGEQGDTLVDYSDSKPAEFYIRRKSQAASRPATESTAMQLDSDGEESFDESLLYPAGGPTARKPDAEPVKKRRLKRREAPELDDETKDRRARDRRRRQLERSKKIKSNLMVHSSDEEDDEERDREFFAKEGERRKAAGRSILKAIKAAKGEESRKRKSPGQDDQSPPPKRKRVGTDTGSEDDDSDMSSEGGSDEDTPSLSDSENDASMASQITSNTEADVDPSKETRGSDVAMADGEKDQSAVEEEDQPVVAPKRRRRAGFIIDDSDSD